MYLSSSWLNTVLPGLEIDDIVFQTITMTIFVENACVFEKINK